MPGSSAIPTLRTNLQTQLEARAGLTEVTITRHRPAGDDIDGLEHIWFGAASGAVSPGSVGSREDVVDLEIRIRVSRPGGDEDASDAAEDRALALYAELEAQLVTDPTVDGACLTWNEMDYESDVIPGENEQICNLDITIRFETELANS